MVLERGKSRYGDDEFLVLCIIEGRGRSEVEEPQSHGELVLNGCWWGISFTVLTDRFD